MKNTIAIIGAMDEEIDGLKAVLTDTEIKTVALMDFHKGKIGDRTVIVVKSGLGKVNAGICAQILCDLYHVDAIINTGVAGSLDNQVNIGDIVIGERAIQHDMNSVDFGFPLGQVPYLPMEFLGDKEMADIAEAVIDDIEIKKEVNVFRGLVVSGDEFVSTRERRRCIKSQFDAFCTEMEGAAVAQCAYLNNIPFIILRAISDKADDTTTVDFMAFSKIAAARNIRILKEMIKKL